MRLRFLIVSSRLMKMRKGEQLFYPSDLAPLAPLSGRGAGGEGF
jgi:hypothetical protein